MKFLEPMIVAFSMYSKIPMPRIEWNKENMKYTMCFFPLIGVVTGALIYLAGMFLDGNIFPKVSSGRLMFAAVMTFDTGFCKWRNPSGWIYGYDGCTWILGR